MNSEIKDEVLKIIETEYDIKPVCPWKKDPKSMTFNTKETGKWFALIMSVSKRTLGLQGDDEIWIMNVKANEDFIMFMDDYGRGIIPAYHMNKKHWITVFLDGTVEITVIKELLNNSYLLVTDSPTKRIYEAVKRIPKGKVATYGLVAEMAGNPKMSRAVGNALHKNPDPDNIPCYRVVNSKGELSGEFAFGGDKVQQRLLEADGIEVINGRVDLKKYLL